MNDEIKEILVFIKDYIDRCSNSKLDCRFEYKDINLLLDYITNLQTKNEYLETWNSEIKIQLDTLQQENETLHENNQNMQEEMARVWKENEELKKKLDRRYYKNEYERIKEENERLKEKITFLRKELSFIYDINHKNLGERIRKNQELEDYKSRLEKAIEYINKHFAIGLVITRNLLNILQNGSENK